VLLGTKKYQSLGHPFGRHGYLISRHFKENQRGQSGVHVKAEQRFVILSGETASRSEAVAESKDPYSLNFTGGHQGILPVLALNEFSAAVH
jgi:hypothetical protein